MKKYKNNMFVNWYFSCSGLLSLALQRSVSAVKITAVKITAVKITAVKITAVKITAVKITAKAKAKAKALFKIKNSKDMSFIKHTFRQVPTMANLNKDLFTPGNMSQEELGNEMASL